MLFKIHRFLGRHSQGILVQGAGPELASMACTSTPILTQPIEALGLGRQGRAISRTT